MHAPAQSTAKVLLITPPFSELSSPYPATAYLTGFLRERGFDAVQEDASLAVFERLFSPAGLDRIRAHLIAELGGSRWHRAALSLTGRAMGRLGIAAARERLRARLLEGCERPPDGAVDRLTRRLARLEQRVWHARVRNRRVRAERFLMRFDEHRASVLEILERLRILDGLHDVVSAPRPNVEALEALRHEASDALRELAQIVRDIEPGFGLTSYRAGAEAEPSFDAVLRSLHEREGGLLHELIDAWTADALDRHAPTVVGLTVPFVGNLPGALRIAAAVRRLAPNTTIVLGGGYANTTLRSLSDPRVFDAIDFVTLDDGERPLLCVLEHLAGQRPLANLKRTFARVDGRVVFLDGAIESDVQFVDTPTPIYDGIPFDRYLHYRPSTAPVLTRTERPHASLTLAHGCYWKKCTFCDVHLDYVGRYEPRRADPLVDQIETIIAETGCRDFHWVDEAAPPALLRALSTRLLERGVHIRWWGNIRFERAFTPDLALLMRRAGAELVTGGLEVASDRLLDLMQKGVTVEQVARVAKGLSDAGVMVHAYLMYGFPTQTLQETVDSLERVRQLFAAGALHSGFWARFMVSEHSPIGRAPDSVGIRLLPPTPPPDRVFSRYEVPFIDPTGVDHGPLGIALAEALRHYQLGLELDRPAHTWFAAGTPPTTEAPDRIARALATAEAGARSA